MVDTSVLKSLLLNCQNMCVNYITIPSEKPFKCKLCIKSFADLDSLRIHDLFHSDKPPRYHEDNPNRCPVCLTTFSSNFDRHFHEKIHAVERQHGFQSGRQALEPTGNRKTHKDTNASGKQCRSIPARGCTEQKQYACEQCGKVMTDTDILNEERTEGHNKQDPIECLFCDRAFGSVALLKIHVRIHVGEKPYSCLVCGEAFARTSLLNAHVAIHNRCLFCDRSYGSFSLLEIYIRIHADQKLYGFPMCSEVFAQTVLPNANAASLALMLYSADGVSKSSRKNEGNVVTNVRECTRIGMIKNKLCLNCKILERILDVKTSKEEADKILLLILNGNLDSVQENSLPCIIPASLPEQSLMEEECHRKGSIRPVASPYGCGLCDEMFEIEKEFFEHCCNHFGTPVEDGLLQCCLTCDRLADFKWPA